MRALFVCLCALGLAAAEAHAKTKLVVLGIEAVDEGDVSSQEKTAAAAKLFTEALRGRVNLLASRFTVPPNSFRELTEVKILSNCLDESTACMTQVGKELGAEKLLFGKLEKGKGGYTLTVKLLNVGSKSYERSPKSATISLADATSEAAVKEKASQVFADLTGTELTGSLTVKANVETGTVLVGGDAKGELAGGVAEIADLPEGSLLVSIEAKGYRTAEQQVAIVGGRTAHVDFTLEPDGGGALTPAPGGGDATSSRTKWKITGWVGVAAGVGMGAFAAYAHWGVEEKLEKDVHDRAAADPTFQGDVCTFSARNMDDCDKGRDYARLATYFGVAGGVIGAAGLAVLVFKGYAGESGASAEPAVSRGLRVTPVVSADGGGASLLFRF